ncbi:MAG: hypothetical protein ACOYCE_04730 [Limnochordia bacterium]|jgi:hypothetical protein|nr:hypothetical protein [Bacillota bacterium]
MESLWSLFIIYIIASVIGALMKRTKTPSRPLLPDVDPEEVLRRWARLEEPPAKPMAEPGPAKPLHRVEPLEDRPEPDIVPSLPVAVCTPRTPFDRRELVRGVIWGEILRPPRALRPYRPLDR